MAVILKIEGMHCGGCVRSVEQAARGVESVETVSVSLENNEVVAEMDPALIDRLVTAIEDSGFDVVSRSAG
jgi:copper chaperone